MEGTPRCSASRSKRPLKSDGSTSVEPFKIYDSVFDFPQVAAAGECPEEEVWYYADDSPDGDSTVDAPGHAPEEEMDFENLIGGHVIDTASESAPKSFEDPFKSFIAEKVEQKIVTETIPSTEISHEFRVYVSKGTQETIMAQLGRYPNVDQESLENPTPENYKVLTEIARNLQMHSEQLRFNALHQRYVDEYDTNKNFLIFVQKFAEFPALWDATHKDHHRTDIHGIMWKSLEDKLVIKVSKLKQNLDLLRQKYFDRWKLVLDGQDTVELSLTAIELYALLEKLFNPPSADEQNDSNRLRLADQISQHEIIWNRMHQEYSNIPQRDAALKDVGKQLNLSIDEVKQQWAYLREYFFRQYVRFRSQQIDTWCDDPLLNLLQKMLLRNLGVHGGEQPGKHVHSSSLGSSLKIAETIFENEILWSKRYSSTKHGRARVAVFNDVANRLGITFLRLHHRWHTMREKYCAHQANFLQGVSFEDEQRSRDAAFPILAKMGLMDEYGGVVTDTEINLHGSLVHAIVVRVQQNRVLWNRDHSDFADWRKRDAVFGRIAADLNITKGRLLYIWRTIRALYHNQCIQRQKPRENRWILPVPLCTMLRRMNIGKLRPEKDTKQNDSYADNMKVAELIQEKEIIWNKDPRYPSVTEREAAFKDVAKKLGIEVAELYERWTSLQDWYKKISRSDSSMPSQQSDTQLFFLLDRMLRSPSQAKQAVPINYVTKVMLAQTIHLQPAIWADGPCPEEAQEAAFRQVANKMKMTVPQVQREWKGLQEMFKARYVAFVAEEKDSFANGHPILELLEKMLMHTMTTTSLNSALRSQLAEEIAKHKCLVDSTHPDFLNAAKCEYAWFAIQTALGLDQEKAKNEWLRAVQRVREEQAALARGLKTAPLDLDSLILLADRMVTATHQVPPAGSSKRLAAGEGTSAGPSKRTRLP